MIRSFVSVGPTGEPAGPTGGRRDRDGGASPIELAILMPAIIVAMFASIQVAAYFLARSEALAAAEEGVTAQRSYLAPTGAGEARATSFIRRGDGWLIGGEPHVTSDPTQVTVTVSGAALSLVPGWHWTVTQSAHGTVERVTTPGGP